MSIYDVARHHLSEAKRLRQELMKHAHTLLTQRALRTSVRRGPGQSGEVWVTWQSPARTDQTLTSLTNGFAQSIKGALDQAVIATAQHVCAALGTIDSELHDMPLAASADAFDSLVASGYLPGLRPDQVRILRQLQPFVSDTDDDAFIAKHIRTLADLLELNPQEGSPVALWAHSADPTVRTVTGVDVPVNYIALDQALTNEIRVAMFELPARTSIDACRANPSIGLELILTTGPRPTDPEDNLASRTAALTVIADHLIAGLERSVSTPSMLQRIGSLEAFVPPERSRGWLPIYFDDPAERDRAIVAIAQSDIGFATVRREGGPLTILRARGDELVGRQVAQASVPDPALELGPAVERASLRAAADWGLPDMVFNPRVISKGSGIREVGDGTIVSGRRGLAVQVKARDSETGDPARERSWLTKKAKQAARQAKGTIRTSLAVPGLTLRNLRGRDVQLDGRRVQWLPLVILDHPDPPDLDPIEAPEVDGVVLVLRSDWEYIWDHLRSVAAVVDYFHRVAADPPVELGGEAARYHELAEADERADPTVPAAWLTGLGGTPANGPVLPPEPASAADGPGHAVFRTILDDIAKTAFTRDENDRLEVLALIDRYSVTHRADLGRTLLRRLDHCAVTPADQTRLQHHVAFMDEGRLHLVFSVMSMLTGYHHNMYETWLLTRRQQFLTASGAMGPIWPWTVSVILTPRPEGDRLWDTTMIATNGPPAFTPAELSNNERIFPVGEGNDAVVR